MRYRYPILGVCGLLLLVSAWIGFAKLKQEFHLGYSVESLSVYMVLKASNSLQETEKLTREFRDKIAEAVKGRVENIDFEVGRIKRQGQDFKGFRFARLNLYIPREHSHPAAFKRSLKGELQPLLDEYLVSRPELFERLSLDIERQDGESSQRKVLSVVIAGQSEFSFLQVEQKVSEAFLATGFFSEYLRDEARFSRSWRFVPDHDKLSLYELDTVKLSDQLRSLFSPEEIREIRVQGEVVKVFADVSRRQDIRYADLDEIEVINSSGIAVPLSLLGNWVELDSARVIEHRAGERQTVMNFAINEAKGSLSFIRRQSEATLERLKKELSPLSITLRDADEQQAKNRFWAFEVASLCVLGVLFVLAVVLNSISQPILVATPIPFGLMGIVWALYLHDLPLGLMALVGLVGTVGVSVNASIVMVDQMNRSTNLRGRHSEELIVEGAAARLRAIFLTTVTTLLGVFPMAYGLGGESGFTQPLAFAMGWGLGCSALATVFILPAFLAVREDVLKKADSILERVRFSS